MSPAEVKICQSCHNFRQLHQPPNSNSLQALRIPSKETMEEDDMTHYAAVDLMSAQMLIFHLSACAKKFSNSLPKADAEEVWLHINPSLSLHTCHATGTDGPALHSVL